MKTLIVNYHQALKTRALPGAGIFAKEFGGATIGRIGKNQGTRNNAGVH